ncbi:MAG: 16S rRNA (guanine(966)-N(2))-methyltransferase RsmD [Bifidobacteriaceae bacterium]|nr:16S rRNA (guanine(966)-N(2))-methyltransferase RsmD [Bifidobacteriaceae bacterium]
MARIIAGAAGGRVIKVPAGGVRPTANRVREAVFSQLEARLGGPAGWAGLVVADLFAGSGGYALEALSRGAARAFLVEAAPAAARVAAANARALGFGARAEVVAWTVERALARGLAARAGPFGLVFLDPPYATRPDRLDVLLAALAAGPALAPGALVVVERSARGAPPAWPGAWRALAAKVYGDTAVHLAQAPPGQTAPGGREPAGA